MLYGPKIHGTYSFKKKIQNVEITFFKEALKTCDPRRNMKNPHYNCIYEKKAKHNANKTLTCLQIRSTFSIVHIRTCFVSSPCVKRCSVVLSAMKRPHSDEEWSNLAQISLVTQLLQHMVSIRFRLENLCIYFLFQFLFRISKFNRL